MSSLKSFSLNSFEQLIKWLNLHLSCGPMADAAMRNYVQKGRVCLRLFIDGRRDVGGRSVTIATIKVEGHAGNNVELTCAIVDMVENHGALSTELSDQQ